MTPPPVQQIPQEVMEAITEFSRAVYAHAAARTMNRLAHPGTASSLEREIAAATDAERNLHEAIRSSLAPQQQPVVGEVSPEVQGRIQEIRRRLEAATPGPWEVVEELSAPPYYTPSYGVGSPSQRQKHGPLAYRVVDVESLLEYSDAELIAHAPADLKFLLDLLGRDLNP